MRALLGYCMGTCLYGISITVFSDSVKAALRQNCYIFMNKQKFVVLYKKRGGLLCNTNKNEPIAFHAESIRFLFTFWGVRCGWTDPLRPRKPR